jgi:hypothetical protein
MRKLIISLLCVAAVVALATSVAAGHTKGHAAAPLCGTLYTPPCAPPSGTIVSIASCKNTGTMITMPASVHAIAGLKTATVTLNGKTIKVVKFSGRPKNGSFHVTISTRGFKPGVYSVKVTVTDVRGTNTVRIAHFSICTPKPVFTG